MKKVEKFKDYVLGLVFSLGFLVFFFDFDYVGVFEVKRYYSLI